MDAEKELQKVSQKETSLTTFSTTLNIIGTIAIIAGVITFFIGCSDSDSHNGLDQLQASSMMTIGIGSAISGLFFLFFGAVGKAVNDIRNYAITDFRMRYNIEDKEPETASPANANKPAEKPEEPITHDFKVGETVKHKKRGFKMKVEKINGNRIMCNRGFVLGYEAFDADELEHYTVGEQNNN